MQRRVGILRHTLFLPSERFIPDQAAALPRWRPILVARDAVVATPVGLDARRLPGAGRLGRFAYTLGGWKAPLRRAIRSWDLDLLHAHFGVEGVYSRRAAERSGVPHVVTLHGFDVSYSTRSLRASRRPAWLRYASERRGLLESDSVFICVSEHVRSLAVGLGMDPARSVLLPTGVDTALLLPSPIPASPRIVHIARLVEKKGTADLIDALAALRAGGVPASLDIIGDGPLRGDLAARAERLGIGAAVRFHGVLDHRSVLQAVRDARVLCQPSVTASSGDTEGLGQAILEAAALRRPVVATDHGGIREIITDGRNGLLVPERDPAALAQALGRVLTEPDVAERFADANLAEVRERFDLRRQSAKLADVYDALVEARPVPAA